MDSLYIIKNGKSLRCGYTTGSCAAGAAKAAAIMLINKKIIDRVKIDTPKGIKLSFEVENQKIAEDSASCSIIKDAGDDPDATDGMSIFAEVSKRNDKKIIIDGGTGIGRITKKGLFGEIGEAAINPVPRKMIENELLKVSDCGFDVIISAPLGEKIAKKTFNENIGIKGGISILGTSGIVEPMSDEALLKTIYLEIDCVYNSCEDKSIIFYPGNLGESVAKSLNLKGGRVKISNFIGDSVLYAYNKGFKKITLIGHIGKLSKLSIGAFNTHSHICDVRMEAFIYYLALNAAPVEVLKKVKEAVTTEEALKIVYENGQEKIIQDMKCGCVERLKRYIKDESFDISVIMYSMEMGVL